MFACCTARGNRRSSFMPDSCRYLRTAASIAVLLAISPAGKLETPSAGDDARGGAFDEGSTLVFVVLAFGAYVRNHGALERARRGFLPFRFQRRRPAG